MQLIEINGKTIKLCSGMTEESFAKTKYSQLLGEKGLFASADFSDGEKPVEFTFSDWSFDTIRAEEWGEGTEKSNEKLVIYEGTLPSTSANLISLTDQLEKADDKLSSIKKAGLLLKAMTQALSNGFHLPECGGGILSSFEGGKAEILFLPEELFSSFVSYLDDGTYNKFYGFYVNPLLEGDAALAFTMASISYKAFTNQFPFENPDRQEHLSDILDKKYLPVEYTLNGFDPKAAFAINTALTMSKDNQTSVNHQLLEKLADGCSETSNQNEKNRLSALDFEARKSEFLRAQNAKIETKRKLHKNSAKIITGLVSFAILMLFVFSTIKTNGNQPTTKGLTPAQVTECFFQSINDKDVQLMMEVCKGNKFKPFMTTITNMHVANAASQAYTFSSVNVAPHKWFFFAQDNVKEQKTSLFGISNLEIEGKPSLLDARANIKKEKPLTVSGDEAAKADGFITQSLSYYAVQTDPESGNIEAEFTTGYVTLSWLKNRWILTDIDVKPEPLPFDTNEFKSEYWTTLKACNDDVVTACQQLRFRYPWIPSRTVMENEEKELKELF